MSKRKTIFKVITIAVMIITLILAAYIMLNRKGVVNGYDFGAGAYYYADIPTEEYSEIDKDGTYQTSIPKWIYYLFFFVWGWLMWRFWIWIDGRKK